MKITRESMLSGVVRTIEVPVTPEQIQAWQNGALIQDAMPELEPEWREFVKTGITPDEWQSYFGEEDRE